MLHSAPLPCAGPSRSSSQRSRFSPVIASRPRRPTSIVRVGERMVTLADFKRYLERNAGTDLAQVTPEVASAMLDQYVEEVVLSEYAASHGVEVPAEKIASAVRTEAGIDGHRETRRDAAAEARRRPHRRDRRTPTDDDVRAYYEQHPAEFSSGEEVHVRQILVHDESARQRHRRQAEARRRVRGAVEPVLARAEREEGRRDRLRQPRRAAEDVRGRDLRAQAGRRQPGHPHRVELPHLQGAGPPRARASSTSRRPRPSSESG